MTTKRERAKFKLQEIMKSKQNPKQIKYKLNYLSRIQQTI